MKLRPSTPGLGPSWGQLPAACVVSIALLYGAVVPAFAQPPKGRPDKTEKPTAADPKAKPDKSDAKADSKKKTPDKVKTFDFDAMDLNGRMRAPQLLYFLERANEELERASLEKRSFMPRLVKSLEEESL